MAESKKSNISIFPKEKLVSVLVNPEIYPLEVIYSAGYVFTDRAYIFINGDPKKGVTVELKPKGDIDLETLGREFNNELLNYANYKVLSEKNSDIRKMIIQRALLTNEVSDVQRQDSSDDFIKDVEESVDFSEDIDFLEDPEGIAIPWEEKYGKESKQKKKK